MKFTISTEGEDAGGYHFVGEPRFTVGVPRRTPGLPEVARAGDWLCCLYAAWGGQERSVAQYVVDLAEGADGRFCLMLKTFHEHSEVEAWLRDVGVGAAGASAFGGAAMVVSSSGGTDGEPRTLHIGGDPAKTLVWVALRDGVVRGIRGGVRTPEEIQGLIAEWFPAGD